MTKTARRTFLKTSGALGLLAAGGGVAPAFAQPTKLHLLQWVDFIPEGDAELRRMIAEYNRQMKMDVTLETINANALADVSELCEWKARDQGGYYPHNEAAARAGARWLGLPWGTGGILIAYRRSWFAEVGASEAPRTLEEYRKLGIALKKKGKPFGQTLGHTFGDAPAWTYPLTWTFGGAETEPSGKRVVLNSKGTIEAVKWMVGLWKDACDEGALAWDDTNNNRAFHAGEISATLNGASIYIFAKRNPEKIRDDAGQPMWQDISHFSIPDGPLGRTAPYKVAFSHAIMKYSRQQKAAREFLKWLHAREQFGRWFEIEEGYSVGATTAWENHPMWAKIDDALKPFRTAPRGARMIGYAGPPTARASEALTKYIITDMYAKAVQGLSAEDAVRWAEGELKKIYEG